MYGHDLIEDLKNNQDNNLKLVKNKLIKGLQDAHHFFLGDMGEVLTLVEKTIYDKKKTRFFQDHLWETATPPYSLTCLHFSVDPKDIFGEDGKVVPSHHLQLFTKIVILIHHCKDGLLLNGWEYFPNKKKWISTLFTVAVEPNSVDGQTMISYHFPKNFSIEISEEYDASIKEDITHILRCANMALILLNTKNIVTQEHRPPVKLNKKRIKKGKQPLFTYHTLRLQLPGKRKKSNGKTEPGDNTTRLHLCRGHFKTYTEENPLFGKFTGRYWWQPHARGNKDEGVVMKNYAVEKI